MSDDSREYFESVAHKLDEMRRTFFGEGVRVAAMPAAALAQAPASTMRSIGRRLLDAWETHEPQERGWRFSYALLARTQGDSGVTFPMLPVLHSVAILLV